MDEAEKKSGEQRPGGENSAAPVTRRELLILLGSVAIVSGIDAVHSNASELSVDQAPLPPGLYQPSFDHLNHALTNESAFVPIPPGAETEYLIPRADPFVPKALAPTDLPLVRRLVEIILGEGLRDKVEKSWTISGNIYDDVVEWIDLVVASAPRVRALARNLPADQRALAIACLGSEPVILLESFEPERVCREGLLWISDEAQRQFEKSFLDADPQHQLALVRAISDSRPDKTAVHAGTQLFDFLKAQSIRGFYTSRTGLKELDYKGNAFYGSSPGCAIRPNTG